jgi:hypothetical protein
LRLNKIFFALLFFTALCSNVFSQGAFLQLSLYDDSEFSVTLDNTSLSAGNYAEFDNVSPGEHILKVVRESANVPAEEDVIFNGKIKIPAGDSYAVIDEYNTFLIYKKKKYNYNRLTISGDGIKKCGTTGTEQKESEYVYDECKNNVMKKENFDDLRSEINNRNFEQSNITILKSALEKNFVSSEQLKELLGYFTFENNKLEIAKYSYKRVCDQKNFFKVYEAFTFDSSIEELKNYISGK